MTGREQNGAVLGRVEFITTHWNVVLTARDCASSSARRALGTLCQPYWYPLYSYVRRQGHSPEDAQPSRKDSSLSS